jgi:hypothetical protein
MQPQVTRRTRTVKVPDGHRQSDAGYHGVHKPPDKLGPALAGVAQPSDAPDVHSYNVLAAVRVHIRCSGRRQLRQAVGDNKGDKPPLWAVPRQQQHQAAVPEAGQQNVRLAWRADNAWPHMGAQTATELPPKPA